jgi:hypothetical protein
MRKQKRRMKSKNIISVNSRSITSGKLTAERLPWYWRLGTIVSAMVTFIGLFLALLVLWPRVTVDAVGQADPQNVYSQSFLVKNIGYTPLNHMRLAIAPCMLETEKGDLKARAIDSNRKCIPSLHITNPKWEDVYLAMDESFQFRLDEKLDISGHPNVKPILSAQNISQPLKGDFVVSISYQVWFWPFKQWPLQKAFRFIVEPQSDGKLQWKSRSMDDQVLTP